MVKTVAFIPARGGSKGIPRKNLQLLAGQSLLQRAIGVAQCAQFVDEVVVSTDSEEISVHAIEFGAKSDTRPPELAKDSSLIVDAIREFWARYKKKEPDVELLVLLEPTSPFRTSQLIDKCVRRVIEQKLDSLATFSEASVNPERTWRMDSGVPVPFIDNAVPWRPRQELTPAYQLNGLVYVMRPQSMPDDGVAVLYGLQGAEIVDGKHCIDIDNIQDLEVANVLFNA